MLLHPPQFEDSSPRDKTEDESFDSTWRDLRVLWLGVRVGVKTCAELIWLAVPYFLYVCAGVLLLAALLSPMSGISVEHTIANSQKIQAKFDGAHAFVRQWRKTHGQLPTKDEFREFAGDRIDYTRQLEPLELVPSEVLAEFGDPPHGAYLLMYWRGEWREYAPSWTAANTLTFEKSDYYLLGSALGDFIVYLAACVAILMLTVVLGKWPVLKLNAPEAYGT